MSGRNLLLVLNPRQISESLLSIEQLDAPKVWLRNYSEAELEEVIPRIIATYRTKYDYFTVVSDDVIATDAAFRGVSTLLEADFPVVTGYCNLDATCKHVSLTRSPPREPYATEATYDWMTMEEVAVDDRQLYTTYHPSMAMTGMSAEMWDRYPWRCFGKVQNLDDTWTGWAADLDLSIRLARDEVIVVSPRSSFMYHLKHDWIRSDDGFRDARKQLYVGVEPAETIYDEG